ncbi:MAG: ATP-binding protein [Gammaproteobacteria bacterium]|nr:ATP-binding protein [Gammaproteobacteria bacterium]
MSAALNQRVVELRFPSQADRLCIVRALVKRVAEFVGCDAALAEQLVIAVNEACMNIIQHAYGDDSPGEIVLEIFNNADTIRFRLQDFAAPVDLNKIKPRELGEVRPGGLGTHFISEIMDECKMGHLEGNRGNYLEMSKRII